MELLKDRTYNAHRVDFSGGMMIDSGKVAILGCQVVVLVLKAHTISQVHGSVTI